MRCSISAFFFSLLGMSKRVLELNDPVAEFLQAFAEFSHNGLL
jgi:hypothetical protein